MTAHCPPEVVPNKAYELWMLPEGGSPVSLGLLPLAGKRSVQVSEVQRSALLRTTTLAVSLEEPGGSSTGVPQGPVLFTATLHDS